jgi:ATP-binding cassette subfamily B protein
MAGIYLASMLISSLQSWYLTRFDQAVVFDLETDLLDHTLRLPKSFFDETEVGYLMSRLSDVTGLRWFFSGTMVSILTNFFQMIGGIVMLFYLQWRLAIVALIILPGLIWWARSFSRRTRALSHQSMELSANVSKQMQESLSSTSLSRPMQPKTGGGEYHVAGSGELSALIGADRGWCCSRYEPQLAL